MVLVVVVVQNSVSGPTQVTVTGTTPVVASDAEEVFNLPSTSGTSETIKFSSLTSADKDVINNFVAGEDKVQVVSTATGVEAGRCKPFNCAKHGMKFQTVLLVPRKAISFMMPVRPQMPVLY